MTLLGRASRRYLFQHRLLSSLSVLGVAMGVAVVLSIDLTNASVERAFSLSADALAGRATDAIVGGPDGVPETVYARLRVELGVREAAPIVEGYASVAGPEPRTLTLLGVDVFAEAPFRPFLAESNGAARVDVGPLLTTPGGIVLADRTAASLQLKPGDALRARVNGRDRELRLVGTIHTANADTARALDDLAVMDVASAQELLEESGRLTRIELRLPAGESGAALASRIDAVLPGDAKRIPAGSRAGALAQLTRAFRTNLTALSLLALMVGFFLIYNASTFSVVQRRPLLGRLRALGVTRRELFTTVLAEAGALGALGTALGALLGLGLAQLLLSLVTQTVNDLYFVVSVRSVTPDASSLLKAVALGLLGTPLAAAVPAWEAARAPVQFTLRRSSSEEQSSRRSPLAAALGLVLLAGSGALFLGSRRALAPAYLGLFCLLLGAALLAPALTRLAAIAVRPLFSVAGGFVGRLAARGVAGQLSRAGVAVAALMVAISSTVGVGVMVTSFRDTVVEWLEQTLRADVYVSAPSAVVRRGDGTLTPEVVERLEALPDVEGTGSVRVRTVRTAGAEVDLVAVFYGQGIGPPGYLAEVWPVLVAGDAVAVSEPLAFRQELRAGDSLTLETDAGPRVFRVAAVYPDYGSEQGAVLIARPTYHRHFADRGVSGFSLKARPGVDVDTLVRRAAATASPLQNVTVRSNRALRALSLEIFDRTFTITAVLRILAVAVAFAGVLSALLALGLERTRELAILRALGFTPRQVGVLLVVQTVLLGAVAGLFALPLGLALAGVLVKVISPRSFGWSLPMSAPPSVLVQAVGLSLLAALLAGLYPAWRMSGTSPARALEDE